MPIRTTITSFGPTLLSKVLGLNATQESSLGLIFHFADKNGLALLDLKDLRAVTRYLVSDDGKAELTSLGGLSSATAGVILRQLIAFEDQGADVFFGEPEFDTADLIRIADDGRGVVTCLELPAVQQRPQLFSTFLMWLLADLFHDLPEVGDVEMPKLVFFFEEASKPFQDAIEQTVRLIRSKGVGIFFVAQSPKDVPADVLAQLGNRVQHQLRAFMPQDSAAIKAAVSSYPHTEYDLAELLTQLGTGEAVITVLSEKGAPTPVAHTMFTATRTSPWPRRSMRCSITESGTDRTGGTRHEAQIGLDRGGWSPRERSARSSALNRRQFLRATSATRSAIEHEDDRPPVRGRTGPRRSIHRSRVRSQLPRRVVRIRDGRHHRRRSPRFDFGCSD